MVDSQQQIRIGVFGHYGNRNLGDESIITSVIENLRARVPDAQLVGFSLKPLDTAARYNIPSYSVVCLDDGVHFAPPGGETITEIPSGDPPLEPPLSAVGRLKRRTKKIPVIGPLLLLAQRTIDVSLTLPAEIRFLRSSSRALKGIDLLMISGSNQLLDNFGGAWMFPFNLLKWTTMAKMAGAKVVFASVGAGPLDGWLSKLFLKWALAKADYVSFRDSQSKAIMTKAGYRGKVIVCPDLAHGLPTEGDAECIGSSEDISGRPRIALNPMPIYDKRYWCDADSDQYEDYIGKLATFAGAVVKEGYPLSLFMTQPRDVNVIDDVIATMKKRGCLERDDQVRIDVAHTVNQLTQYLSGYGIVVATRFHGVLLALFRNKPTIGICYGPKTEELMVDMGQGGYCSYFEDFSADDLLHRLHCLEQNAPEQIARMKSKSVEYRDALDRQYDSILGLLSPRFNGPRDSQ